MSAEMAVIELRILQPRDDQAFAGNPPPEVCFQGELLRLPAELANVPLYYRWYSSFNKRVDRGCYSLNQPALTSAGTVHAETLPLGSHAIAFGVCDRAGETDADFQAIGHTAVSGGNRGPSRCVIHVISARILDLPGTVPRTALALKAEAPGLWGEDAYHCHGFNQLGYRWTLTPVGTMMGTGGQPLARPTLNYTPTRSELHFQGGTSSQPSTVTFLPVLPVAAIGDYEVVLWVEDMKQPIPGRQATAVARVNLLA